MHKASKISQDIVGVLSDKQWHPIYEFYRFGDDITAEKASSVYMRSRNKKTRETVNMSLSDIILRGRKRYVDCTINAMRRDKRIFMRKEGTDTEIMLNDTHRLYLQSLQNDTTQNNTPQTRKPRKYKRPEVTIDGLAVKIDPKSGMLVIALPINELKIAIEQLG